jgi:hypothetical protein
MDMGGAVPMDMHSGYDAYDLPQPGDAVMHQQTDSSGEHPAERLRRLQEEAAQLAAQQSQVSLDAMKTDHPPDLLLLLSTACCRM